MHFFPRIFFLEYSMFHYYLFLFPFGFSYIALASTACGMIHTMLFFWNRYELPAMAHGLINASHPRSSTGGQATAVVQRRRPRNTATHGVVTTRSATLQLANDGDEDEREDYRFFMDGEVVTHETTAIVARRRRRQQQGDTLPPDSLHSSSDGSRAGVDLDIISAPAAAGTLQHFAPLAPSSS